MNRIDEKFRQLKQSGRKAFIAFVTAGDPDLKTTQELVLAFEQSGADLIELGIPFSDPLADGPTIQESYQYALKNGISLEKTLHAVAALRQKTQIPIILMTSYNPVFIYGEKRFVVEAKKAGVDGVIVPDLPPEEAQALIEEGRKNDFATIFFLAPTTNPARMKKNIEASTGFIYFVSLTGTTGVKSAVPETIREHILRVKKHSSKPICVGFGIRTKEQARQIAAISDGVIVGSAIVKEIAQRRGQPDLVTKVASLVGELSSGLE